MGYFFWNPYHRKSIQSTVSGTDSIGNAYAGTESITFTVDTSIPTVIPQLLHNDPDNTIKVFRGDNITVT